MSSSAKVVEVEIEYSDWQREIIELSFNRPSIGPPDILDWAKEHPESAVAKRLDWDDRVAGEKWRLHQCAEMLRKVKIRVQVDAPEPQVFDTRRFTSARPDRGRGDGSYRPLMLVLTDEERMSEMLATALSELRALRRKYASLRSLSEWATADSALAKILGEEED